jgi:hypothetical protein
MIQHDAKSFKKFAVLTGLTVLVGGAEISAADAATTTPETRNFSLNNFSTHTQLQFDQFNPLDPLYLNGTLTGVKFDLNSNIQSDEFSSLSATIVVNLDTIFSGNTTGSFTQTANRGPSAFFVGSGQYFAVVDFNVIFPPCDECVVSTANWAGSLSVSYTFDPPSEVPLPAALPLFASGAAGLGFMGWLRRLKQKAKKQA